MLKRRVIPILLWDGKTCVKPKSFNPPGRNVGNMMQFIETMNSRDIDELIFLDINATKEDRPPRLESLKQFTGKLFCPVTIGGGIKTLSDISDLLRSGADKVAINSRLTDESFVKDAVKHFGAQAIVASVDVKTFFPRNGGSSTAYRPTTKSATEWVDGGLDSFIYYVQDLGVGEILLTYVDRDGTRAGYDQTLINRVTRQTRLPVIVNGGCSGFADMLQAFKNGAHAVAAGSLFLFTSITPKMCAQYIENNGIPMRIGA